MNNKKIISTNYDNQTWIDGFRKKFINHSTAAARALPPYRIDIHLAGCNLKCTYCVGTNRKGTLEKTINTSNIVEILRNATSFQRDGMQIEEFNFAGDHSEPTMDKYAFAAGIKFLKQEHRTINIITNGTLLSDPVIQDAIKSLDKNDSINISLDAPDRPSFLQEKGVDLYDRTIGNIHKICASGIQANISVSFVVIRKTLEKLPMAIFSLPAKVRNIFLRHNFYETDTAFMQQIKDLIKKQNDHRLVYRNENIVSNPCVEYCHAKAPAISYDAKLYRCAHNTKRGHEVGDLMKESFEKIWDNLWSSKENLMVNCAGTCSTANALMNKGKI